MEINPNLLKSDLSPVYIKSLNFQELDQLASEIRGFLTDSVSKTGGHLASNLGIVELTLALHRSFCAPKDKLVFDVGHQTYVHKMLTGRMQAFESLRKLDGLSGFPKKKESEYDLFDTGHSSTAISSALGLATARDLKGEQYYVVAIVGDGALTGGLAMEALNHLGHTQTKVITVLNDNEMSISKNVGGLAQHLNKIRTNPHYSVSKKKIETFLRRIPGVGNPVADAIKRLKDSLKYAIIEPGTFFEALGIKYLGPVDGHDIRALEAEFSRAKTADGPCLVHVVTKKGKGYSFAEENPQKFHGIAPFNKETGETALKKPDFSSVAGNTLCTLAEENPSVAVVCPSMCEGCGLTEFAAQFPSRFFDVGIAEGHAVTFAAALASSGLIPVVTVYSSFLQRAFDNVIHDMAINNVHMVIAVDRAGLVGQDGETHQGIFDISFLRTVPNLSILAPASFVQLEEMLRYAVLEHSGPIAIRYPRGGDTGVETSEPFVYGKAQILKTGHSVTIAAEGSMVKTALTVSDILTEQGYSAEVINLQTIKPLDRDTLQKSARKTRFIVTLENNTQCGGLGEAIIAHLDAACKKLIFAFPDTFVPQGTVDELMARYEMDPQSIARRIVSQLRSL